MEKKLITLQLMQIEELTATVTRLNKIAHGAYVKIDELEKIITKLNQAAIASAKEEPIIWTPINNIEANFQEDIISDAFDDIDMYAYGGDPDFL